MGLVEICHLQAFCSVDEVPKSKLQCTCTYQYVYTFYSTSSQTAMICTGTDMHATTAQTNTVPVTIPYYTIPSGLVLPQQVLRPIQCWPIVHALSVWKEGWGVSNYLQHGCHLKIGQK